MTQEEKQLLLKDLCSRLPYELWVKYNGNDYIATGYGHGRVSLLPSVFSSAVGPCPLVEEVRPYLRSMSSMTEEEKEYVIQLAELPCAAQICEKKVDFFLSHHIDWRNLIPKGLALEAPEGMYKTE